MDEDTALPERPGLKASLTGAHMMALLQLLGIALAYAGQWVLLNTRGSMPDEFARQALATGMLLAGAFLFGLATRGAGNNSARFDIPPDEVGSPAQHYRPWAANVLAAAMILALVAFSMFKIWGESPAVVILWLASIVALFVAQLSGAKIRPPRADRKEVFYLAALAGLLIVALLMRAYHLTLLPYNVDGDFANVGLQARALVTGEQQQIFAFGWAAVPMLGYLPPWLTMQFLGTGLAGLNASGVLEGLLIILGVYLLGRDLFNARVGLLAAALMTISYASLAASRQSSYIDPVFFLVFAVYFLVLGLREGRGWSLVAGGIMTALCLEMYHSGRIVVFVIGSVLLFLLIFRRAWLGARKGQLGLWTLAVLITLGPMLLVILRDPGSYVSRSREVFILNPDVLRHMQGVYQVNSVPAVLLQQARRAVLMFNYYADKGTQFGSKRPFLDPFTAPLFGLGIGYAMFHWRRLGSWLLLAWTGLGVFIGCFLTVNPPFWTRLMILLPPVILLAAIAFGQIYELADRYLRRIQPPLVWVAPVITILVLTGAGVLNWHTYVEEKGTFATPRTRIARYLADQPPSTVAYLLSQNFTYRDREFQFLAPGRIVANLTTEQLEGNIEGIHSPALLILTREQEQALAWLKQRYPDDPVDAEPDNAPGEIAFYVFHLP